MAEKKEKRALACYRWEVGVKYLCAGTKGFCNDCGNVVQISFSSMNGIRKELNGEPYDIIFLECLEAKIEKGEEIKFIHPTNEQLKDIFNNRKNGNKF